MAENDNNNQNLNGGENNANGKENGGKENANDKKENGGDLTKQFEELQKKFSDLETDAKGKDKKISEYQKTLDEIKKERENKDLESKTADEKLTVYEQKIKSLEQKEAFREAFKEVGLIPDDFQEIVNEADPAKQAKKFAELLKKERDSSATNAVEEFKKKELEKIPSEPKPKDKTDTKNNQKTIQKPWNRFRNQ